MQYISSFVGYFPANKPKYSCIVVIHDPNKKKGYYGATVAAPVFKEIAQKIYTSTPIKDDIVKENFSSEIIQNLYTSFNKEITENIQTTHVARSASGITRFVSLISDVQKIKIRVSRFSICLCN